MGALTIIPLEGIASVQPGDNLADLLVQALDKNHVALEKSDVLVIAQKIVSKAEGRYQKLSAVEALSEAQQLAEKTDKDPALVQLILNESSAVIRARPGVLITRNHQGFVMANAGIDASNLDGDSDTVLLLPEDSDQSASQLRQALKSKLDIAPGIVIADSFGRPWREGVTNVAIGVSGIPALLDKREQTDRAGRELRVTQVAVADLLSAAAGLLMGEGDESIPAVVIKGIPPAYLASTTSTTNRSYQATDLVRPPAQDLFT